MSNSHRTEQRLARIREWLADYAPHLFLVLIGLLALSQLFT